MKNKYDNDFVKQQLHQIYFKESSYEDCAIKINEMVKSFHEQYVLQTNFKKDYYKNHLLCPICLSKEHTSTLMSFVLNYDDKENFKDLNKCHCENCGNVHFVHDRINTI